MSCQTLGSGSFTHFCFPFALGEIETGLILVFEVEDHGDAFVGVRCWDSVESSGAVITVFVIFYGFLGIAHF